MYIINGYLITEIFDIDYPDKITFKAEKYWDDYSFDKFYTHTNIYNNIERFEYIYNLCENRTMEDIINHHYEVIFKHKDDFIEEDYINIKNSFKNWKNRECTIAVKILNNINTSDDINFEDWKQSLITHLKIFDKDKIRHLDKNFVEYIQNTIDDIRRMLYL